MSILVKKEILQPANMEENTAVWLGQIYLAPDGLKRREVRSYQNKSDTTEYREYRDSDDNGRTWGEWVREPKAGRRVVGEDEIEDYAYQLAENVWNPVHKHMVSLRMQMLFVGGYEKAYRAKWKGNRTIFWHSFVDVEDAAGNLISHKMSKYEDGADFCEENYHETDYLSRNQAVTTHLIVLKNGDIMFAHGIPIDTACRLTGQDVEKVFPSVPLVEFCCMVGRGVWNAETKEYDLSYSEPIILDDRVSSRCTAEPIIAELDSGKILLVFRMSNLIRDDWNTRISPYAPSYKMYCLSDDGGKTFAPPMPWHFDTREVIYSSATVGRFLRDERNGRLYWIGNITDPTKNDGNYPRYPLYIVEVDREWGCAIKETLTMIDTRQEGETEQVQLSNWMQNQDRETGDVEVYLTKIGQFKTDADNVWKSDAMKYTITLPND